MIADWPELKSFARGLELPKVEQATSWGNEVLKAHGKLWCWWSPYIDAALFKCDKEERDMLRSIDPDTYPVHAHYEAHNLILVAAGRVDPDWTRARLLSTWRAAAPKRFLKDWDAAQQ